MKEESEKVGLKLNIHITRIMTSGPITSWQIDGETVETVMGRPRGMVWGGRREEGSGWGTHVYLWQIHFDIWQN